MFPREDIPKYGVIQWRSMAAPRKFLPYLALGITIISLGFAAFFVRWANAPAPVFGFYRLGLATLILTPFFASNTLRARHDLQPSHVHGWWVILPILAGLASGLDHFTWNTSLKYTSAANAALLGNTSPLWVALVAWLFFKERARGLFWIGLALTMVGAVAVLGNDFLQQPVVGWGDLLALSASTFYACFFLLSQRSRQRFDTLSHVWICSLSSTLVLLILSLATGASLTGYSTRTYLSFFGSRPAPASGRLPCHGLCARTPARIGRLSNLAGAAGGHRLAGNPAPGRKPPTGPMDRGIGHPGWDIPGPPQPGNRAEKAPRGLNRMAGGIFIRRR